MAINKNIDSASLSENASLPDSIAAQRMGVGKRVIMALSALTLSVGLAGKPSEAEQIGERYAQSSAVAGTITDAAPRPSETSEMSQEAKERLFIDAIKALPEGGDTYVIDNLSIMEVLESFRDSGRLDLVEFAIDFYSRYSESITVEKMLARIYFNQHKLDNIPAGFEAHQEAIVKGMDEMVAGLENSEDYIDDYGGLVEWINTIMTGFLDGTINSDLEYFVEYAPEFTEYVLAHPESFVFAEQLSIVQNTFQTRQRIAEMDQTIAENERTIAENERTIAENERTIAENEGTIAENERTIAENERTIRESQERQEALRELNKTLESSLQKLGS